MLTPFPIIDLASATVGGELLPQLANGGDYTPLDKFVELVRALPENRKLVHHLAINGNVIADPMECYLSHPYVSSSQLKAALSSPRHFKKSREPKEDKRARHFELGTFTHEAILEPERFDKVVVEPKAGRNTIEGLTELVNFYARLIGKDIAIVGAKMTMLRETLDNLIAEANQQGYEVVSAADMEVIQAIKDSLAEYGGGIIPRIMRHAQTETSMYYNDREHGLGVRIRPDGILLEENLGTNIIISVKTTSAQSVNLFMRDCIKHRYALAEGMYIDVATKATGRKFTGTLMIMAQTVEPYNVAAIYWSLDDLNAGLADYYRAIPIAKSVLETNEAPGFEILAEDDNLGIIESFINN
jgi:hypothetical protein